MSKRSFVLLLAVLVLPKPVTATPFTNLFVVGDSLSDVGNLFIATSVPPLNMIPLAPLPQDPYYMGRFSDGPVWIEYVSESLGLGPSVPSFAPSLGGTNYAVGGARSRYHRFDLDGSFNPLVDMTMFPTFTLLGQSQTLLNDEGGMLDPGALYTVWSGANDVADAVATLVMGGPPAAPQAQALVVQAAMDIVGVVGSLVDAGAQTLLVPNVPNIALVPELAGAPPPLLDAAEDLTLALNGIVDAGLATLSAEIIRLDTFQFLNLLVADPEFFGLPAGFNVTDACFDGFVGQAGMECPDPENYAFWDMIHPSAVTHELLGGIAAAAVPEPSIVAILALGLIGLGFSRRKAA